MLPKITLKKFSLIFFLLIASCLSASYINLAFNTFFADSEIWSINVAYHFWEQIDKHWVISRPLFHGGLFLITSPSDDPILSLYLARLLMVLNTFLTLSGIYLITKELKTTRIWFLLMTILLLVNTGFVNQGFRVRSDLLAGNLFIWSLYLALKYKKTWCLLLPLLATPKFIFFVVPSIVCCEFFYAKRTKENLIRLSRYGIIVTFFTLPLLIYKSEVVTIFLKANYNFLVESIIGGAGSPTYFSTSSFYYILRQISNNIPFWILFVTSSILYVFQSKKVQSEKIKFLNSIALMSILVLLVLPEKLPFVIASLLPLISLITFANLHFVFATTNSKQPIVTSGLSGLKLATGFLLAIQTIAGIGWTQKNLAENNNKEQIQAIDILNDYLTNSNISNYFDIIGIIPAKSVNGHFVGPNQKSINALAIENIKSSLPLVFVYIHKSGFLEPDLTNILRENYIELDKGIYIRSMNIRGMDLRFQRYKIESLFSRPNEFGYSKQNHSSTKFTLEIWDRRTGRVGIIERTWSEIQAFFESSTAQVGDIVILKISPFIAPNRYPNRFFAELFRFDSQF